VGFLVIVAESLGAVGLIVGFCSRIAALGISLVMLGAILLVHLQHGFFANWFGIQQGEGIEYFLLALGLGITIMIVGSGRWSVDSVLSDRLESSIQ
jgi:putative oxidoreductase